MLGNDKEDDRVRLVLRAGDGGKFLVKGCKPGQVSSACRMATNTMLRVVVVKKKEGETTKGKGVGGDC
eukprot:3530449-Rhodomonas_salina.3